MESNCARKRRAEVNPLSTLNSGFVISVSNPMVDENGFGFLILLGRSYLVSKHIKRLTLNMLSIFPHDIIH